MMNSRKQNYIKEMEARCREHEEALKTSRMEQERLARRVERLKEDRRVINIMYENALRLRDFDAAEKERQYMYNRLLLEAFPHVLAVLDKDLNYVIGTERSILNRINLAKPRKLKGTPARELLEMLPDRAWAKRTLESCQYAMESKASLKYKDEINFGKSNEMHLSITVSPAIDQKGDIKGLVVLIQDITELILAKEEAEAAVRVKSDFLANMSHEIRTPMNAIISIGNLLHASEQEPNRRGYIKNMLSASETLLNIINDVLDFSKIDAQKMEAVSQPYEIIAMINEVINLIALRAAEKNLEFVVHIDPRLPKKLMGNDLRIKQVLINLLSNALKYTKKGRILFRIEQQKKRNEAELTFTVEDTGIGIKREEISYLFDAFSQLDIKKNRGIQGTGLGLAICKGIAQKMGGNISVTSTYRKGSTFQFKLCQEIADDTPVAHIEEPQNKHVLIWGDNYAAELLADTLNQVDVRCDIAKTEEAYLQCIEQNIYSHLFFWEKESMDYEARIAEVPINKTAIKRIFDIPADKKQQDNILFEPLLISDIAQIVNKGKIAKKREHRDDYALGQIKADNVSVLVVDDNEINCVVAKEILKNYGMHIETVLSGEQAIRMVEEKQYDLIFMDHMMPDMDGIESTMKIRELGGRNAEVPIIALTANTAQGVREMFRKNGMDGYISKPIQLKELNDILCRCLPKHKLHMEDAGKEKPENLKKWSENKIADIDLAIEQEEYSEQAYRLVLKIFKDDILRWPVRLRILLDQKKWKDMAAELSAQKSILIRVGKPKALQKLSELEFAVLQSKFLYIEKYMEQYLYEIDMLQETLHVPPR
ncbi:MAG: ATP-binding protein [Christensenella sp.]|uniref:ATP-binding protein n=1 Tax=Christensenella sp. TaxID=1935934 RepID=UPI002B1FA592|nr:ATP-binding protein [Christensenella sp.]MEA5004054.1 ATP-binding protein [Christensenella sp.]